MLKEKIEKILNEQIEKEGYSSHLYLAMASWAETEGFKGISEWLYAQAEEERVHMLKLIHYINDRDGHARILKIKDPPATYPGIRELFNQVLEHERYISASINEIAVLSAQEKDYTTHNWIQWFVTEQIEEEASVREIIDKLKLVGEHNMYMFDRDIMGMRSAEASGTSGTET